jgi:predicted neuraminidase
MSAISQRRLNLRQGFAKAVFGRPVAILLAIVATVLLLPQIFSHDGAPAPLAMESIPAVSPTPLLERETISIVPEAGILHAPSLVDLGNGELLSVWYQGSREGGRDVSLYTSRFTGRRWGPATRVTDANAAGAELGRYVKTIGNAVLLTRPQGELWLVYVSVSIGGWSGSSLNLKRSADGGRTWSKAKRLVTSPFFNLSTLVKGRPMMLTDGSPVIPAYHEMIAHLPELLILNDAGQVTDKIRMGTAAGRVAIQPTLAILPKNEVVALLRPSGAAPRIFESRSSDGGRSWSVPLATDLPNPGGPVGLLPLEGRGLMLVFNNDPKRENNLTLAVSEDGGSTWTNLAILDETKPDEKKGLTYPFLMQSSDGTYHLVYVQPSAGAIRHIRFNDAWVHSLLDEARPPKADDGF